MMVDDAPGMDLPVGPCIDQLLPLKRRKVFVQLSQQFGVLVGVGYKSSRDFFWCRARRGFGGSLLGRLGCDHCFLTQFSRQLFLIIKWDWRQLRPGQVYSFRWKPGEAKKGDDNCAVEFGYHPLFFGWTTPVRVANP